MTSLQAQESESGVVDYVDSYSDADLGQPPLLLVIGGEAPFSGILLTDRRAANLVSKINMYRSLYGECEDHCDAIEDICEIKVAELIQVGAENVVKAAQRRWWENGWLWGGVGLFAGVVAGAVSVYYLGGE